MKEIASTFQTFYQLLKHIITRLRNNSMVEERTSGDFSVRFLLLKNELSQFSEADVNEVLNTFLNQDKRYEDDSVTLFEYNENESYYAIKSDKEKVNTLQNIYANLWMLNKDSHKQKLFMQFVEKTKEWKALPLYKAYLPTPEGTGKYLLNDNLFPEKSEIYELCVEIFDKRQAFPKIADNEERYTIATEQIVPRDKIENKVEILEEKAINAKTAVNLDDIIRNEYVSYYDAHPTDYNNKETLENSIYDKLKVLHPYLAKKLVKTIGKDVRKVKNMSYKGRPKGRGNVH